jgi:glycosyltransferase involved in cell wall biosynthesis
MALPIKHRDSDAVPEPTWGRALIPREDRAMSSSAAEIDVLLATWNGERFIEEQLESLFRQTFQGFRLIVRDDASNDSTLDIVERYRSRYPGRVVVQVNPCRMGPSRTFSRLAETSVAPYVAFCDQDDIWREDKLEISVASAKRIEAKHGVHTPVLVFSDVTLVGQENQTLAPSMWRMMRVHPRRASLGALLVQDLVSGCTVLANRSLQLRAMPFPEGAVMHDSWLGLVAAAFGILHPLYEATVRYRQHEGNAIGAGGAWSAAELLKRLSGGQRFKEGLDASRRQSQVLARRYADLLTAEQKTTLQVWSDSQGLPAGVRQWTLYQHGLRRTSLLNNLVFLARV